jgi:1,4-alpha-glucan branching enzyme
VTGLLAYEFVLRPWLEEQDIAWEETRLAVVGSSSSGSGSVQRSRPTEKEKEEEKSEQETKEGLDEKKQSRAEERFLRTLRRRTTAAVSCKSLCFVCFVLLCRVVWSEQC